MAAASQPLLLPLPSVPSRRPFSSTMMPPSSLCFPEFHQQSPGLLSSSRRRSLRVAMVASQGATSASAKESLLLAFKDAGGFEAVVTGKTTDVQRIDVNERIIALERLNPTPRPATSPFLEGKWNFEWFDSSGLPAAARLIMEKIPSTLADLSKMDIVIKDGSAKITANLKLLNSIESKVVLSTKLSVEGPLRMKEEYVDGTFETPSLIDETLPDQLKGALGRAANTVQQLPVLIRDAINSGIKVPLGGTFQRLFFISYLDDEIIILRNDSGTPEVLSRLDAPPALAEPEVKY